MSGGDFRYFSWEDQKWYDSFGKQLDLPHPPKGQIEGVLDPSFRQELDDFEIGAEMYGNGDITLFELKDQVDRLTESVRPNPNNAGGSLAEADALRARADALFNKLFDLTNGGSIDLADLGPAAQGITDELNSLIARTRSYGQLASAPRQLEYIPALEAMNLSMLTSEDARRVFSKLEPLGAMIPRKTKMPDGFVAMPSPHSDPGIREFYYVKDGYVHAHASVDLSDVGHGPVIQMIRTTGELSGREAERFFRQAMGEGLDDPSQIVDIMMRGKPVKEWLRNILGRDIDDTSSMKELLEAARVQGFENLANPVASESVTEAGARSFATMLNLSFKEGFGKGTAGDPKMWPQHRKQFEVFGEINHDIIDAIATGSFGDGLNFAASAQNEKLQKKIVDYISKEWAGNRPQFVHVAKEVEPTLGGQANAVVERMFSILMTTPTNKLSRSPAFKPFYWKRVAQLTGYADETVQRQIQQAARRAGLDKRSIREWAVDHLKGVDDATLGTLDRMAGPGHSFKGGIAAVDGGITDFNDIDQIAKAFALEETKRLLYDLSTKHNISQMTRNIFPFGEAWFEIFSSWSRIMSENPRVIRRLQQGIEGARESGFFYPDPSTGEEMFNYPGSELLGKWMFGENENEGGFLGNVRAGIANLRDESPGVNPQLAGRVQGLNLMAGSFMPGVGPVVQIPASKLKILQKPEAKWVRDLILPFGAADVDSLGSIVDDVMPSWFKKFLTSIDNPTGDNERLYANTVIDVYKALLLSGKATDDTPENADAAMEMAKEKAKYLYRMRAFVQFAGPTGPSLRFDVRDKNGELWAFQSLASTYREMTIAANYDHAAATKEFVTMFGLDPSTLYTSKSVQIVKRSVTEEGVDWQARNPDLFKNYALTAYYANPDKPNDPFDYNAYLLQLEEKTRVSLSPEDWTRERNDFLGRLAYEKARKAVGARTDDAAIDWLRTYRYDLMQRYPGYNEPTVGLPRSATRDQTIAELKRWEDNPTLRNTEAGVGLGRYMRARQMAVDYAILNFGITEKGFSTAKKTEYLRDWLRQVGATIVKEQPDFGPLWEAVLFREIEEKVTYDDTLLGEDFSSG